MWLTMFSMFGPNVPSPIPMNAYETNTQATLRYGGQRRVATNASRVIATMMAAKAAITRFRGRSHAKTMLWPSTRKRRLKK
jgi:hypothetical protein